MHTEREAHNATYGGENSLDIESINKPDASYDVILCNHVLEHIADDRKGFKELIRILSQDGFMEVTVPNPFEYERTNDWGYPREDLNEHYRTYGKDIRERFESAVPLVSTLIVKIQDPSTASEDLIYFWYKSGKTGNLLKKSFGQVIYPG